MKAQFWTFDESSYEGNPLLCGPLLQKKCGEEESPSQPMPNDEREDDGFIDMYVFRVTFGVCCIIVVLTIAAVLYINPPWRRRWFHFIEDCIDTCYYFLVINFLFEIPVDISDSVYSIKVTEEPCSEFSSSSLDKRKAKEKWVVICSFITLFPEVVGANKLKDFKPISRIGCLYKIISNLQANRLKAAMPEIIGEVGEVQHAFINGRQILDSVLIAIEIICHLKKSKSKGYILKLDFHNAFDSVIWEYIDEVMECTGFGVSRRGWIKQCIQVVYLYSQRICSSKWLSPIEEFSMEKGLRQGDSLSPFLFNMVAEDLSRMLKIGCDLRLIDGIALGQTRAILHITFFDSIAPDITATLANNTNSLVKQASISSCAYVTFLAGDGDYWKGVVGLAKGLRKAKSNYPLVVAILPDVPEEHRKILASQGCLVREIEPVNPPENQTQFAMAYYVINYSKLRIWEFVEYSKMIYLDGDIQVFDNIDHLFDMPDGYFYAAMDCFCEKTWCNSPQYKVGYCQQCPDKVHWPAEMGPKPPLYFNAGMFVYEPNLSTYHDLLETLKVTPPTLFAEQDFLNMFFRDVYKPIPSDYNLVLALLWRHPENINLDKVKVVHYCAAGSKPWRYTGKEDNMDREDIKMLVNKWWDIYHDESLDCKNTVVAAAGAEVQPFLAALSEAGIAHYITAPSAA
ncbi:PREDICTED: uncharacterized protein LOC105135748 [Populus euphratica]|uniref:Hexosyltransferase n=1 Tax=Populus euphratica TaxID=75702 RepID=A0AAJ6V139_POPEU|nr:PREDICTED: uncharacterized protein LOC105135748 [Populus euphratica]